MALTSTNLIINMTQARIEMSNNANKMFVQAVLGDGAGDFNIWDATAGRAAFGYFRDSNKVILGNDSTSAQIGTSLIASQNWVNSQGFSKNTGTLDVSYINSPGNMDLRSQMANGTIKTLGRFQVANSLGAVMLDIGSNPNVASTGNWWAFDCNHALRVLNKTSQPALSIDWSNI